MENNSKSNYLAISVVVAAILIVGAIIYVGGKNNSSPSQPAAQQTSGSVTNLTPSDVILGNKNAPVTLIEYGDYQCPYCAMFQQQIEPALNLAYVQTGKLRMIFREMSFVGAESQMAAQASYCANDQGKFWDYHDLIYKTKLNDYEINSGKENDG
jgi:protein-disulfide isomerase